MNKTDVVSEVSRLMTAALNAAPGEVRDTLRNEAPGVVKSLATMATSATKSSDRKWAFRTFFGLVRSTVLRDTALQNAIARRHSNEAENILAQVSLIEARNVKAVEARKRRSLDAKYVRFINQRKGEGENAETQQA